MALKVSDPIQFLGNRVKGNLDDRYGPYNFDTNINTTLQNIINSLKTGLANLLSKGLKVGIIIDNKIVEYTFQGDPSNPTVNDFEHIINPKDLEYSNGTSFLNNNGYVNSDPKLIEISNKIDKLPTGYYYGLANSVSGLPDASELTQKGYAYVASEDPSIYYIYLFNGEGSAWEDSGNKFVTTELETDLETKSQTKAPTTKAVQEGIEAIDITTEKEYSSEQKEIARENLGAQEDIVSMENKLPVVAALNDRAADVAPVTNEVRALGYKVLDPSKSFAEQITEANTIYEIRDEFNLDSTNVTIEVTNTVSEAVHIGSNWYHYNPTAISVDPSETVTGHMSLINISRDRCLLNSDKTSAILPGDDISTQSNVYTAIRESDIINYVLTKTDNDVRKTTYPGIHLVQEIEIDNELYFKSSKIPLVAASVPVLRVFEGVILDENNTILSSSSYAPSSDIDVYIARKKTVYNAQQYKIVPLYQLPTNCGLKFNGGKLKNGTIACSNTNLIGDINLDLVTLSGTIINEELKASYFGIKYSTNADILTYNDAAFECLVTSCENCSHETTVTNTSFTKIINVDKDIAITEPVEIERSNLNCAGTIYYVGSQDLNGAVIKIEGNYGEHVVRLYNNTIKYWEGTYEGRKDLPIRGVTVTNFRQGHITFVDVNNFTSNVVFESITSDDYVAYNTFDFWNIRNGMYALTINVIKIGWINNNTFNRGTFNVLTESKFKDHNIAFLIKGNSYHGANQLHFNDNNIENSYIGIYLDRLKLEDSSINRLRNENVSNSNLIVENNVSVIQQYYKNKVTLYRDNIGQENLYYRRFVLILNDSLETKKTYSWELSCLKKGSTYYFKQPVTAYTTPSGSYYLKEVYAVTPGSSFGNPTIEASDKFLKFNSIYYAPIFIFNHSGKFIAKLTSLLGNTTPSVIFVLLNKTFSSLNGSDYRTITTDNGFINPDAPLFSESVPYSKWDQVYYEGKYYRFTSAKSAGDWDDTKVVELTAKNNSSGAFSGEYNGKGVSAIAFSSPLIVNGNAIYDINLSGLPTSYYLGMFVGGSLSKFTIEVKSNSTLISENEPSIISCSGVPDSMIGYFPKNMDGTLVRGYSYWDSTAKKPIYWNSSAWVDALGEPAGLQVSDTSVLIDAADNSTKDVYVYYSGTVPTITVLNSDDTANTWLTAAYTLYAPTFVANTYYSAANTIVATLPSNWNTNYMDYFTDAEATIPVAGVPKNKVVLTAGANIVAPTWAANTYFSESGGNYNLLTSEPDDWGTNYVDYYTEDDGVYTAVVGVANNKPRGAKVLVSLGDELVIINVVQSY